MQEMSGHVRAVVSWHPEVELNDPGPSCYVPGCTRMYYVRPPELSNSINQLWLHEKLV